MEWINSILFIYLVFGVIFINGRDYNCNFETNTCEWQNDKTNEDLIWVRNQGSSATPFTGPSEDHTLGLGNGWYIYVDVSGGMGIANLLGPSISGTYCLQFWYHMYGADVNSLFVYLRTKSKTDGKPIFFRSGSQGNRWKEAIFSINNSSESSYQVVFSVEHRYKSFIKGDIALDDISLQEGICQLKSMKEEQLCTFDDGYDCGFKPDDPIGKFGWKIDSKKQIKSALAPKTDHTLGTEEGGYMHLYTSSKDNNTISAITSPRITKANRGDRCVHFYYYFNSQYVTDAILNVTNVDGKKETLILSKNKMTITDKEWKYAEAAFTPGLTYKIKFSGSFITNDLGSINIDDVKITSGVCPESGFCTFEENFCTWENGNGELQWLRNRGSAATTEKGPSIDHTQGNKYGYYSFLNIKDKTPGQSARLKSDKFPPTLDKKRCISFWYTMNGADVGSLKLFIKIDGVTEDLLWELDGHQSENWEKGAAPVSSVIKSYQVEFEAKVGKGKVGHIALDDIYFMTSNESCMPSPKSADPENIALSSLNCTFDELSLCNWKAETGNNTISWKYGNQSFVPESTGPVEPLEGKGHYIYVSSQSASTNDKIKATLHSPTIHQVNDDVCFTFYYHMFGAHVGSLAIYLVSGGRRKKVWYKQGTQPDKWHHHSISLHSNSDFTLDIETVPGEGFAGDIALDNIGLVLGTCPHGGICDFESGLCGWSTEDSPDYYWLRGTNMHNGPTFDHSTGTEYGYYLQAFSTKDATIKKKTEIISPLYDNNLGSHCLTFWYFCQAYGTGDIQFLLKYSGNSSRTIWSNLKMTGSHWNFGQVDITSKKPYQIIIRAVKGYASGSDLAIDDLNLSIKPCTPPGNCDFDEDFCSYSNDYGNADFQWLLGTGRVQNFGLLDIPSDHAITNGLYVYADLTSSIIKENKKAILVSEVLPITSTSCIHFWYFVNGQDIGLFSVGKRTFNTLNSDIVVNNTILWSYNKTNEDYKAWQEQQITVKSSSDYQITFEVKKGKGPRAFVAFDDVTLTDSFCISPVTSPVPVSPTPTSKPDGIFYCDFEASNTCSWKPEKSSLIWNVRRGYDSKIPKFDHTKQNFKGKYVYVIGNDYQIGIGKLTSPSVNWKAACFSFWFYMQTDSSARLAFRVQQKSGNYVTSWQKEGTFVDSWHFAQLNTSSTLQDYKVQFMANLTTGVIALDDINGEEGNCPASKICTFDVDDCNYRQDINNPLSWILKSGKDSGISYPIYDHTTLSIQGRFYYLTLQNLTRNNWSKKARLFSPSFPPTEGSCVTFWYHLYRLRKEKLNGYRYTSSLGDPLWSVSSNEGSGWHGARFSIPLTSTTWQIAFEVEWRTINIGQVAIDDIMVTDGLCSPSGYCDFEDDMCLWQNIISKLSYSPNNGSTEMQLQTVTNLHFMNMLDDNFDWKYHLAAEYPGPYFDQTLGNNEGHYMLLDAAFPRQERERAILMSERINTVSSVCFKFWYFLPKTTRAGAEIRIFRSNNYTDASQIDIWKEPTDNKWKHGHALIESADKDDVSMKDFWIYIVGVVGEDKYGFAAIDDLEVTQGLCEDDGQEYFDCGNKQTVLKEKVCDFVLDCINGKDEAECSTCDFESGLCGWYTDCTNNYGFCWEYKRNEGNSGAVQDHTNDDGTGYYMMARSSRSYPLSVSTELFGPTHYETSSNCYLKFWYNFYGQVKLETYLKLNNKTSMNIWMISRGKSRVWNLGISYIGRFYRPIMLSFVSRKSSYFTVYTAVDDIEMVGCQKAEPSSYCLLDKDFSCDNKVCVEKSTLCDYTDDCGDNSDEKSCSHYVARCNFDSSYCDWSIDEKENSKWTRQTGFSSLSVGPSRDHTSGNKQGSFLYMFGNSYTSKDSKLLGPVFQPTSTCTMRFYYDIIDVGKDSVSLKILTRTSLNGDLKTVWSRTTETEGYYFVRHSVTFTETYNFQVIIEGRIAAIKGSYIALDDISFTPECLIETNPLPPIITVTTPDPIVICTEREIMCKSLDYCVEKYQWCDFQFDCPDKSDELFCGECDFTEGMCGWSNVEDNTYQWERVPAKQFKSNNSTAPDVDSYDDENGWYVLLSGIKGGFFPRPAIMRTPQLQSLAASCKVQFYYHFNYGGTGYLRMNVINSETEYLGRNYFEVSTSTGEKWVRSNVPIGDFPPGYQVEFVGQGRSAYYMNKYTDIAVDDIRYIDCNPREKKNQTLNCTFEYDEKCGWNKENFGIELEWMRGRGSRSLFAPDMPNGDHTSGSGYFMYITGNRRSVAGDKARLVSFPLDRTRGRCLVFWYHMFGIDVGSLNIIVRTSSGNETFWRRSESVAHSWKEAMRTIKSDDNHTIVIEGIMGGSSSRVIAIDDISLWDTSCPHAVECDFEADLCGWDAKDWKIQQGKNNIPSKDHSTNTGTGQYIALIKDGGTFTSPLYTHKMEEHCLQFWYFIEGTREDKLTVSRLSVTSQQPLSIWTETGEQNQKGEWFYGMKTIMMNTVKTKIQFSGIKKTEESSIAIDDVKFFEGTCSAPGNCDFEVDMCTWRSLPSPYSSNGAWLRNSGQTPNTFGLENDHTTGTINGWYAYHGVSNERSISIATLESEHLHYSPAACIKLWYHLGSSFGSEIISIGIEDHETGIRRSLHNITVQAYQWSKFEKLATNLPEAYKIYIVGKKNAFFNPDTAIDDIVIQDAICDEPTAVPPTSTPSEASYWDCNFENGNTCSWSADATWKIKEGRNAIFDKSGPTLDHTKESSYGRYLLFYPNDNTTDGVITSAQVPSELGTYCFKLWYYLYSPMPVSLSLHIIQQQQTVGPFWNKQDSQNKEWKYGFFNIEKPVNVSLMLHAKRSSPGIGDIAIDDLAVTTGRCPILKNQLCDFEDQSICGYQIEAPDYISWLRVNGKTSTKGTSPDNDHTLGTKDGHYMVVDSSVKGRLPFGNHAHLIIPELPKTEGDGTCLRFWYHMFGKDVNHLNIYVRPHKGSLGYYSWSENGNQGNKWNVGQLTVDAPYNHDVVFEVITGYGDEGDIAIDDVIIKDGACPPPGSCNFEYDLCTWQNRIMGTDILWLRNKGPTPTNGTGPLVDITKGDSEGVYIYLQAANTNGQRNLLGILESETFTKSSKRCMSFWYHMNGKEMGSLYVNITYQNIDSQDTDDINIFEREGPQGENWKQAHLNLDLSDLKINNKYQILLIGRTKGSLSDIAIDDIEVKPELCSIIPVDKFDCHEGNGTYVDLDKVCNFEIDCTETNEDEENCGKCDFEHGFCGWTKEDETYVGSTNNWLRANGSSSTLYNNLPSVDHTTNNSYGWYVYVLSNRYGAAKMISPGEVRTFKKSGSTCQMIFWYYIKGSVSLSVRKSYGYSYSTVWIMQYDQGEIWHKGIAYLGRTKSKFRVTIHGNQGYSFRSAIAIDDIVFENCSLPQKADKCDDGMIMCPYTKACVHEDKFCDKTDDCGDDYDESDEVCAVYPKPCTFEMGSKCDWKPRNDSEIQWRHTRSRNVRNIANTGPLNDHTEQLDGKGIFLHLYNSYSYVQKRGNRGWYVSPNYILKNDSICTVRFYYYLFGTYTSTVNIYAEYEDNGWLWELLVSKNSNAGQVWERAHASVYDSRPFHFILEGILANRSESEVAIDDITVTPGCTVYSGTLPPATPTVRPTVYPCRENEFKCIKGSKHCIPNDKKCDLVVDCEDGSDEYGCGPCNFENGTCEWNDVSSGLYEWLRQKISNIPDIKANESDHSIPSTQNGYVMSFVLSDGLFKKEASLRSPQLSAISSHCEVSFWYYKRKKVGLWLRLQMQRNRQNSFLNIKSELRLVQDKWTEFKSRIPENRNGTVIQISAEVFGSVHQSSINNSLFIDDISFLNCNPKILPADCNFDKDFCFWKHDNITADFQWKRHDSATKANFTGPTSDHTTGTGYYIYLDQYGKGKNKIARLKSPLLYSTAPDGSCFSFWYHMYGRHIGTLYIDEEKFLSTLHIWTLARNQGNQWLHGEVFINSTEDFRLNIVGKTKKGGQGDIAVDDVKLIDGPCPQTAFCTFEEGFCGWTHKLNNTIDWIRSSGKSPFSGDKPQTDHTTKTENGHFIYLPPSKLGDRAVLISPYHKNLGQICFELWYNMYGTDIGTIAVYQRNDAQGRVENYIPIFERYGNHMQLWRRGQVTLSALSSYYIVIEVRIGRGEKGYIAIDDIKMTDGTCSNPVSCTFEKDTCGWSTNENSEMDWVRRTGFDTNFGLGPSSDHSLSSVQGHYMYAYLTKQDEGIESLLLSEDINQGDEFCLSAWYYMFNTDSSTLSFKTFTLQLQWNFIYNISKPTDSWQYFELDIPLQSESLDNFFIIGLVASTQIAQDNKDRGIAVDDIILSNYKCGTTTVSPVTFTPVPTYQPSKYDCNFEIDFCLWENSQTGNYKWEIVTGHSDLKSTLPRTDTTTKSTSGHYAILSSTSKYLQQIVALSTKDAIEIGSRGACIRFWYYLYGGYRRSLDFVLQNADTKKTKHFWSKTISTGPTWKYQQLFLTEAGDFYLIFEGMATIYSDVALDDIGFNSGNCLPEQLCTMENGRCGFYDDLEADVAWSLGKAESSYPYGPRVDHTYNSQFGHYFYINKTTAGGMVKEGMIARLETGNYPPEKKCVRFWYHLKGNNVGTLSVLVKYGDYVLPLWNERGDEGDEWHAAQATVTNAPSMPYKYVFQAVIGEALDNGTIAIDDIEILEKCPSLGDCNFENDICLWSNDPASESTWLRGSGEVFAKGTNKDHTFKNQFGVYLYAYNNKQTSFSQARLLSPYLPSKQELCFTYWYYRSGTVLPTLNLTHYSKADHSFLILNHWTVESSEKWQYAQAKINNSEVLSDKFRLIFEISFVSSAVQFAALDDFVLSDGICKRYDPEPAKLLCDGGATTYSVDEICDFHQNCNDKADEKSCGTTCDFEDDLCYWTAQNNYMTWKRIEAHSSRIPPYIDHTHQLKDKGYYAAVSSLYSYFWRTATMNSPTLRYSSEQCRLKFWYYMTSPFNSILKLNIHIKPASHDSATEIFQLNDNQTAVWHHGYAIIGRVAGPFSIQFTGNKRETMASIAIDDLSFTDCSSAELEQKDSCEEGEYHCSKGGCISDDLLCDFSDDCGDYSDENLILASCSDYPARCSFDNGDFCDWQQDTESTYTWQVGSASEYGYSRPPIYRDHTLNSIYGKYAYFYVPAASGIEGQLRSPLMKKTGTECKFRFFYTYATTFKHTRYDDYENQGPLTVYSQQDLVSPLNIEWKTNKVSGQYYEKVTVDLSHISNLFQIIIESVTGTDKGAWIIDDLSFSSGCSQMNGTLPHDIPKSTLPPVPCDKQMEFTCDNGDCIGKDLLCDFIPQCRDKSDESRCGECNFDDDSNPMCGWEDKSLGTYKWVRQNGKQKFAPSVDVSNSGYYMYVSRNGSGQISNQAILQFTTNGLTVGSCTVHFYYYISNLLDKGASLHLVLARHTSSSLWRAITDHGKKWNIAHVTIGSQHEKWLLKFIGTLDKGKADLAIDDIKFTDCIPPEKLICSEEEFKCLDGTCIPLISKCDFGWDCADVSDEENCTGYPERCNFENGLCNWVHDTSTYRWTWFSGRTLEEDTGPDRDHTFGNSTGHYLYIPSSLTQSDFVARIASTKFLASYYGVCKIRLWYHMYGEHISNLSVLIAPLGGKKTVLKTISGSQGDEWKRLVVSLVNKLNFQVFIEGKRGKGPKGDIAIDDISFTPECIPLYKIVTTPIPSVQPPGKCYETEFTCEDNSCISLNKVCDFKQDCPLGADEKSCPSKCTFEDDTLCGWDVNIKLPSNVFWNISSSAKTNCVIDPPHIDITLNSSSGHYLLMCFTSYDAQSMRDLHMASPKFVTSAGTCKVSFWQFSAGSFNTIGLQVNSLDIESIIWQNSLQHATQSGRWTKEVIGLGQRREPFNIFFVRLSNVVTDIFAIDDVEFINCAFPKINKKELCSPTTHYTCKENGACISRDLLCDLSDDCGDGTDEIGCNKDYLITFENGTGFFHNSKTNKYNWTFGNGIYKNRLKVGTGPAFDHTYFTAKGNYIFLSSDFAAPQETVHLVSDIFKVLSHGKCSLRFHYYMFGSNVNELSVYTRTSLNSVLSRVWSRSGPQGDYWQQGSIPFNSALPFEIIIEGKTNLRNADVIALDDISVYGECDISVGILPTTVTPDTTTTTPTGCQKGEWKCALDGRCISNKRKCDFRIDCADGSDENHCAKPKCDFDGGNMCEWFIVSREASSPKAEQTTVNSFSWIVTQANESQISDRPLTDHSNSSIYGWYAIASGLAGKRFDSTSLQTPVISRTHARCIFQFWYYCSFQECPLSLYSRTEMMDGIQKNHLWSPQRSGEVLHAQWRIAKAYVGEIGKFQMQIEAKKVGERSVTVDDITFSTCEPPAMTDADSGFCKPGQFKCSSNNECILDSQVCDKQPDCSDGSDEFSLICQPYYGVCTFEHGICNTWTLEPGTNYIWTLHATGNVIFGLQPTSDHTLRNENGYYLTIEKKLWKSSKLGKARLASHVVYGNNSKNCTLRFWFYLVGSNHSINVYRRTSYKDGGFNLLASYSTNGRIWEQGEVVVNPNQDNGHFKAVLEGQLGEGEGSVSIDDLSMNLNCHESNEELPGKAIPPPDPSDCGPEKFPCKNMKCFTHLQHCNFIDDCGDGSDEADCGTDCNFENGTCGWYNPLGYRAQWLIAKPGTGSLTDSGPLVDHTYNNKSGHFIYPGEGNFVKPSDMAQLHSHVYVSSGPSCTLNFWYHMYTVYNDNDGKLFVLVKTTNRKEQTETIWNISNNKGNVWHQASAEIRNRHNFTIVIGATRGNGIINKVSIDDIKFESCHPDSPVIQCVSDEWMCKDKSRCLKNWQLCDKSYDCKDKSDEYGCDQQYGDCDFNSDDWLQECHWQLWSQNYFNWSHAKKSHTERTGPEYDHSLYEEGYYIFINSSEGSEGQIATVSTPQFPAGSGNCHLRFWYFMYGSSEMGELWVSTYGINGQVIPLANKRGPDEKKWKYIHVECGNSENYTVVFEAEVGGDEFTDIAIDDVTFTEGCREGGFFIPSTKTPQTCEDDEVPCKNGSIPCVPKEWLCDCDYDCEDGSDEDNCDKQCTSTGLPKTKPPVKSTSPLTPEKTTPTISPPSHCKRGFFQCRDSDGTCIEGIKRCDGVKDCGDGYDEEYQCPSEKCKKGSYFCPDNVGSQCLLESVICNGIEDCSDGSDESLCSLEKCPPDYCQNNAKCTLHKKKGFPMCRCGTDLFGNRCYGEKKVSSTISPPSHCKRGFFQCRDSDGTCIEGIKRCDGVKDCDDGYDEEYQCPSEKCKKGSYFCPDNVGSQCLLESVICNGIEDCSDGSDESLCSLKKCPPDYCQNNAKCTLDKNKGFPICRCGTDLFGNRCYEEKKVSSTISPPSHCKRGFFQCRDSDGTCIEGIKRCDGVKDCDDGYDEEYQCPSEQCKKRFYFCPDHTESQCLREAVICNNVEECSDGSDESLCSLKTCPPDYCQNNAKCTLDKKKGFPICSCGTGLSGNRCYGETLEEQKDVHKSNAWIAGVVIGTVVFIAMVVLILRYYKKKVETDNNRGLHTVDNPVYGMSFENFTFGELDTEVPAGESTEMNPTGIENPLYQKY